MLEALVQLEREHRGPIHIVPHESEQAREVDWVEGLDQRGVPEPHENPGPGARARPGDVSPAGVPLAPPAAPTRGPPPARVHARVLAPARARPPRSAPHPPPPARRA